MFAYIYFYDSVIAGKDDTSKPEQRFKAWAIKPLYKASLVKALGHENFTSVFQYQGGGILVFSKKS